MDKNYLPYTVCMIEGVWFDSPANWILFARNPKLSENIKIISLNYKQLSADIKCTCRNAEGTG